MKSVKVLSDPKVKSVFDNYPEAVRKKLSNLRQLIVEVANELNEVPELEETLKWGEPSYKTKFGSTIRIDWKEKLPSQYAMYFQCTTRMIPTFRMVFDDKFRFEGSRAIIFDMQEDIPVKALKQCIEVGLTYHKIKKHPTLGL